MGLTVSLRQSSCPVSFLNSHLGLGFTDAVSVGGSNFVVLVNDQGIAPHRTTTGGTAARVTHATTVGIGGNPGRGFQLIPASRPF